MKPRVTSILRASLVPLAMAAVLQAHQASAALAQPSRMSNDVTVHLTYKGAFNRKATIRGGKQYETDMGAGCYLTPEGPFSLLSITAEPHSTHFILYLTYHANISTYGPLKPSATNHNPIGAKIMTSVVAAGKYHLYDTTKGNASVRVQIAKGGKSGNFAVSHLYHAPNEQIIGSWQCAGMKSLAAGH